eukprot:1782127-Rhodomonas_salina.1
MRLAQTTKNDPHPNAADQIQKLQFYTRSTRRQSKLLWRQGQGQVPQLQGTPLQPFGSPLLDECLEHLDAVALDERTLTCTPPLQCARRSGLGTRQVRCPDLCFKPRVRIEMIHADRGQLRHRHKPVCQLACVLLVSPPSPF